MMVTVIGGSGFVGRHVVRLLLAQGNEVCTVDVRPPVAVEPGEQVVLADMKNPAAAKRAANACAGAEQVVWLAATIRQARDVDAGASEDIQVMAQAPLTFLRELEPAPLGLAYLSSIQVYGQPHRLPVDEDHPTDPFTAYGVAKLCGEKMLAIVGERRDTPIACLRVAFIYGPGQHPNNVIPRFLAAVRCGEPPIVHGEGTGVRDDIYVGDVARSVALALERRAHGVYNVATGKPQTLRDVAEAVCRVGEFASGPRYDAAEDDWIDRFYTVERARESFGFEAETEFDDGLRAMWTAQAEAEAEAAP